MEQPNIGPTNRGTNWLTDELTTGGLREWPSKGVCVCVCVHVCSISLYLSILTNPPPLSQLPYTVLFFIHITMPTVMTEQWGKKVARKERRESGKDRGGKKKKGLTNGGRGGTERNGTEKGRSLIHTSKLNKLHIKQDTIIKCSLSDQSNIIAYNWAKSANRASSGNVLKGGLTSQNVFLILYIPVISWRYR